MPEGAFVARANAASGRARPWMCAPVCYAPWREDAAAICAPQQIAAPINANGRGNERPAHLS